MSRNIFLDWPLIYVDIFNLFQDNTTLEAAHLEAAHLEAAHLEAALLEAAHLEAALLEAAHLHLNNSQIIPREAQDIHQVNNKFYNMIHY